MRILLAEDDRMILTTVQKRLSAQGYAEDAVENGEDALSNMTSCEYSLVILDIMMPKLDGVTVLKRARQSGVKSPVMFLTAKDTIEDRTEGLYAGADDYLVKPFALEELLARVHVLLRRSGAASAGDVLTISDLTLDTRTHEVWRGGEEIRLTSREYAILELLMRNPGTVLSRERIENSVWNFDYDGASNMVDVYIRYLRKKLDEGRDEKLIRTVRYAGYCIRSDAKTGEAK